MVDLHVFNNRTVMPLKSPFFLAPQGMSRTCKSKLFHNPTDTTLADIYTEIMPQNHANLRFHVRSVPDIKLALPNIFEIGKYINKEAF